MLNRAPYNTAVPEFAPARDAPINSYVIRKYPCQEQLKGKVNHFRSLTWKIQQPDSSMVWQSVKLVMPMTIQCHDAHGNVANMNVYKRKPTCNIALSQSPMNAFEQTTLSINGRIFSEVNAYRDTLDACYRGVGAQAYGDNHSLKPIVQRNVFNAEFPQNDQIPLVDEDGADTGNYLQTDNLEARAVDSAFSLLEHNGPFVERARIFQDQLDQAGTTWAGEISHLLEIGPFQARARKGNTAVPYIKDFHLRMNFQNNPSRFDSLNPPASVAAGAHGYHEIGGRVMATKLLEFATLPNFLHHGESVLSTSGWPCDYSFTWSKKPYLEVVYTKYEAAMRPYYNLRCFEHQYEQSNRFPLEPLEDSFDSPTSLQRVTTRLLSLPTKVYVWAELAEEFKHSFVSGGTRRSCRLENLHLRINQRPDVMFNPSQEECYEMFRRHTNSSLEYGSWLKSPVYCFDMVDIGQSDMYSNDARVTWMEWDAEASLTQLQVIEKQHQAQVNLLAAHCYGSLAQLDANYYDDTWGSVSNQITSVYWDADTRPKLTNTDTDLAFTISYHNQGDVTSQRYLAYNDYNKLRGQVSHFNEFAAPAITGSDIELTTVNSASYQLDGYIWGKMCIKTHTPGGSSTPIPKHSFQGPLFYVPQGYRFVPDEKDTGAIWNVMSGMTWTYDAGQQQFQYIWSTVHHPNVIVVGGIMKNNPRAADQNNKRFGAGTITAKQCPGPWAYEIDADGIRNDAADSTYLRGGPLFDNEGLYSRLADTENYAWVAICPRLTHPTPGAGHGGAASNNWMHWRTDVAQPGDGKGKNPPAWWDNQQKNTYPQWGNGYHNLNVSGKGRIGHRDPQVFAGRDTRLAVSSTYGAQLGLVTNQHDEIAGEELYRMKVLYEYGNCQYQFDASGAPTRVLPNLVPIQQ